MKQRPARRQRDLLWPRLVIRKWLNRETRDSDFSADERGDTETEDEDEDDDFASSEPKARNQPREEETNNFDNGIGDDTLESSQWKLRRRKSETFRAQYIQNKELRICVSTWNVGGRLPPDNLDIDNLLDVSEPADLYVFGWQEIVPLNTGNVLGAEDNRPVSKWENLIRDTLNRIHSAKPKYKCFSDPPSPSRFRAADDDPLIVDELLDASSNSDNEDAICTAEDDNFFADADVSGSCRNESICGKELKQESSQHLSKAILTRTLSNSERIGLSWPEQPLDLLPQRVFGRPNSFKSHKSFRATKSFTLHTNGEYRGLPDTFLLKELDLESLVTRKRRSAYVRIVSKQMVGIFISVWVRRSLRRHIQNLKISTVGVGVMGYIGNKGSISVSMSIYQTFFCFVCTHLTSGEKEGDELRRNADVQEIHRRTHFGTKSIRDHEQIIWFGDLNYRINLPYEKAREHIEKKQWTELTEKDQLAREFKKGRAFDGWSEGTLDFPPTYKYELNSDKYYGNDPKAGRRTPAWCDRILSYGKGIRLLRYKRVDQKLSDHRPVTATLMAEVEFLSHRKLQRALTFTDAEIENGDVISEFIGVENILDRPKEYHDWER